MRYYYELRWFDHKRYEERGHKRSMMVGNSSILTVVTDRRPSLHDSPSHCAAETRPLGGAGFSSLRSSSSSLSRGKTKIRTK